MFDRITETQLRRRASRRGAYSVLAAVAQTALIGFVAVMTAPMARSDQPELPTVEVRILAPPTVARARAAAPAVVPASVVANLKRIAESRPGVKRVRPPPPTALIQPREIKSEMRMPTADEPIEAIDLENVVVSDEEGVVGGYVAPVPETDRRGGGNEIEEAPQYATAGFRKPTEAVQGCIARAIRLPPELAGFVSGPVTVRFAVGREGQIGRVEVLSNLPDRRIDAAILRALQSCRWIPGADPQGQPIALWVVMPVRFESG